MVNPPLGVDISIPNSGVSDHQGMPKKATTPCKVCAWCRILGLTSLQNCHRVELRTISTPQTAQMLCRCSLLNTSWHRKPHFNGPPLRCCNPLSTPLSVPLPLKRIPWDGVGAEFFWCLRSALLWGRTTACLTLTLTWSWFVIILTFWLWVRIGTGSAPV